MLAGSQGDRLLLANNGFVSNKIRWGSPLSSNRTGGRQ